MARITIRGVRQAFACGLDTNEIVAPFRERRQFKPGRAALLKPTPDRVHIFDAETGDHIAMKEEEAAIC